ncbi:formamidopyrimidine-DNA glycosylase [Candidatus Saccharibacteria bacterium RAAC3_TM7_1]|nr:formamidopyrimidine-DNA glycosylase [Candidatus Saccharibacteria bacterium RAAC3_TM7_1]HCZ28707.1 bifunctional DNA-formamidopyrimidine glycosylase/DNA-(apurinic or apyrimidinic site) lyase [Candidatus Saccharibacteria bacterium]
MPELPEVETIRRGLELLIVGKKIVKVTYDWPKGFPNSEADISEFLVGASISAVRRRAKVLLIELSTNYTLVTHLKMTGQLVFRGKETFGAGHPNASLVGELPDKSTRVIILFDDDSTLYFNDQRKFGWMKLYPTPEVANIDFMKKVGPEPLEDDFTAKEFVQRIRRRNGTTIKAAILDQTVLAGVGNIYADESLWGAKLHPATRVRDVSDEQVAELLKEIKYVMNLAIEKGGSTDKNYVNAEGKRGSYIDFARVFRQEGKACPRHPDVLIEKIRVAGRGTHICPVCQLQ